MGVRPRRWPHQPALASNGAALLGLRGLVFKSHGSADALAFEQAIARAYDAAHHQLLERVQSRIAHALPLLQSKPTSAAA